MAEQATIAIQGGTVVNAGWSRPSTVLISGDRITAILDVDQPIPSYVERVIDADGSLVIPGGVDPHCHIKNTIGQYTTRDDYHQASEAALWGGTTTVIDFAIPTPGQSPLEAVALRRRMAETSRCATALHGCVTTWDETIPKQLREMAALGVRTVKLFTTYRGEVMAEPDTVLLVMQELKDIGGIAYVHAEANHLIEDAQWRQSQAGGLGAANHAGSRPELAEAAAVAEVLATAESLESPVYFVHQTTSAAVGLVQSARRRGVRAYTETCPHYLALDDSVYSGQHPEQFVCCPPLRSRREVDELNSLVNSGHVHTVGSDHCCYDTEQKNQNRDDVRQMPNGLPGVELRLPVTFSRMVVEQGGSVEPFVALVAANPAKLNGLYPRKGVIAPGADADVVIFDPKAEKTVEATALHMATDYSPYEGKRLTGWARTVIAGGRVVLEDGDYTDPGPSGIALYADPLPPQFLC